MFWCFEKHVFGFWFLGLCVRKFGYEVVAVVLCVSDCYMYNKISCFYFSPCEMGVCIYIHHTGEETGFGDRL